VLLGPEYQEASKILPFLVFMPLMYTISETTVLGINFYKKPKWHIVIAGVSCICNIIGNWVLVPQFGGLGAALSTAFSFIVFFMLRTHISLKYYKVNYGLGKLYT
ncbi:lipopolysaccharide biosynthesis protein, partial [Peribacillus simplex]